MLGLLLAHVAFKLRALGSFGVPRLVAALVLLALTPLAREVDSPVTVGVVGAVLWGLLVFEGVRYAESRRHIRHADAG